MGGGGAYARDRNTSIQCKFAPKMQGGAYARGEAYLQDTTVCTCVTLFFFFLILELNRLIVALDAVAEKALSSSDSFTPERKKRIIADIHSSLKPPPDAPGWAIKPDCRTNDKGNLLYLNFL